MRIRFSVLLIVQFLTLRILGGSADSVQGEWSIGFGIQGGDRPNWSLINAQLRVDEARVTGEGSYAGGTLRDLGSKVTILGEVHAHKISLRLSYRRQEVDCQASLKVDGAVGTCRKGEQQLDLRMVRETPISEQDLEAAVGVFAIDRDHRIAIFKSNSSRPRLVMIDFKTGIMRGLFPKGGIGSQRVQRFS